MDDDLDDLDGITELVSALPTRIDGVSRPASGTTFVLLKSVAAPRRAAANAKAKMTPAAREAFLENAQRVKAGKPPKRGKADKKRRRRAQPAVAVKAALSGEVPATNCTGEASSILAAVTGERSNGMCNARTANGLPCQRPAVAGNRCHMHL